MNTVSSIEQYLKSGFGFQASFQEGSLRISPKILTGMYYLEIDDDVPKMNDFNRNELDSGFKASIMYGADILWDVNKDLSLSIGLEEWNEKGQWLERYTSIELEYKKIEDLTILFSIENTIYNLSNFEKDGIDILPWNKDTLFKLTFKKQFK